MIQIPSGDIWALSVVFTKVYILFPILNLGIILERYLYIYKWNMHKFIYCNIVSDKKIQVKSTQHCGLKGLHFIQRLYPSTVNLYILWSLICSSSLPFTCHVPGTLTPLLFFQIASHVLEEGPSLWLEQCSHMTGLFHLEYKQTPRRF